MQDFQSIPGLAGRIFAGSGGGGGGADHRRFRGYPGGGGGPEPPPPAAKCPRCDSTNTKFCYYNNYNLSQPRHFCKACRRYWTKGGVLRNVPVGGGCRKSSSSKKSSSSSSSKKSSSSSSSKDRRHPPSVASRSSSDSSSLTAATDASASASASDPALFASISNASPEFDPISLDHPPLPGSEMFPEAGTFTSLMVASAGPSFLGLNFSDPPPLRLPAVAEDVVRMPAGFMDQTALAGDLPPLGKIGGMDWPAAMDPSLFELTGGVDPGTYWNQSHHWGDTDPNLFLP